MDFPMTADVALSSQSGGSKDFMPSTQGTESSSFSKVLQGESSSKTNQTTQPEKASSQNKTTSVDDSTKTTEAKPTGNDVPEEGQEIADDEAKVQLSKEERQLLENLAEQGDPLAKELLELQSEDGTIPLAALEALKKSLSSADAQSAAGKTIDLLQFKAAGAQSTLATAEKPTSLVTPTTTDPNRPLPVNTSDPDAAVNTTAKKDEADMNLQQMLEKRLSEMTGKTASVSQNANGTAQVTELPRALANQPTTTSPTVPQSAVSIRQPGWDQALTNSVQWMMKENLQEANIRVRPAELGPIQVKVSMNGDQLSLNFNAAHAATREALDSAMPRLREALAASGMDLGNVDVSDQGLAKQFQQQEYSENAESTQAAWQADGQTTAEEGDTEIIQTPLPSISTSAVDIFA